MSSRIQQARLVARRRVAEKTDEFVFAISNPQANQPSHSMGTSASACELRFRPGQFISINVGTDGDGNPILRSYSIASPPERRGELSLILRLVEGGVGSRFFDGLRSGDAISFTGPMGFFVNELSHAGDIVYVATGTGIAPILPMIEEVLRRNEPGRVLLFWGLRREADLFGQDELAALSARHPRFACHVYLSQPQGFYRLRGRVIGPVLELLPSLREPTFYLCGNGQMIEELKAALIDRGVSRKRQIRSEAFFD
ncbi:MAG: hypothetical protein JNJ46_09080 [Myxococcales bacterium]|nr:hypothetical protein [Myxococcales bacterium]